MQGKKISFQEAQKKFSQQGRTDICLCKDGYNGWKKKSKFIDTILNQEFWSIPYQIWKYNSTPLRNKKKITFQEAKERFEKQGRTNIVLLEDGYDCWIRKAKFFDKILKQEFWAIPSNVYEKKSSPLHAQEKREQTNIKKYGAPNPAQVKEIQEKIKQTCLKKYKTESPFQSPKIKEKIKQTCLKKYKVENPAQSKKVQEKIKQTCLKKYKAESPFQSPKIKEKIKQTCLKKYKVENPAQSKEIREKTVIRFIEETGEILKDWLQKQPKPKPAYVTICTQLPSGKISVSVLEKILKNYKDYKSNLEIFTENLFDIKHFNKEPENFNIRFKPDFKLNDQIFLNVDGLYWHSEKQKEKKYHFNLRKEFEENRLQIFQFYENEVFEKTDIVKSIIDNAIGKISNRIFARKCEIKFVPHKEAQIFLNQNHLMGSTTAKHIGLYYQNKLVSILSYKHKKQKTVCNIERFCSKININVVGGFSKLLNHLEINCLESSCQEIYNWVDLRYGIGKHLFSKGFELKKETLGWKWTDKKTTYNRLKCRANMDERKLTEQQHADELGWCRIYDAGQRLYVKSINKTSL